MANKKFSWGTPPQRTIDTSFLELQVPAPSASWSTPPQEDRDYGPNNDRTFPKLQNQATATATTPAPAPALAVENEFQYRKPQKKNIKKKNPSKQKRKKSTQQVEFEKKVTKLKNQIIGIHKTFSKVKQWDIGIIKNQLSANIFRKKNENGIDIEDGSEINNFYFIRDTYKEQIWNNSIKSRNTIFENLNIMFNEKKEKISNTVKQLHDVRDTYKQSPNKEQIEKRFQDIESNLYEGIILTLTDLQNNFKVNLINTIIKLINVLKTKYNDVSEVEANELVIKDLNKIFKPGLMKYPIVEEFMKEYQISINLKKLQESDYRRIGQNKELRQHNIRKAVRLSEKQKSDRMNFDDRYPMMKQAREKAKVKAEIESLERQKQSVRMDFVRSFAGLRQVIGQQIEEQRHNLPGSNYKKFQGFLTNKDITPSEFQDPITFEMMRNPVVCSDGITYDIETVMRWEPYQGIINGFTGMRLDVSHVGVNYRDVRTNQNINIPANRPKFFPNQRLKSLIDNYIITNYGNLNEAQIENMDFNF